MNYDWRVLIEAETTDKKGIAKVYFENIEKEEAKTISKKIIDSFKRLGFKSSAVITNSQRKNKEKI